MIFKIIALNGIYNFSSYMFPFEIVKMLKKVIYSSILTMYHSFSFLKNHTFLVWWWIEKYFKCEL